MSRALCMSPHRSLPLSPTSPVVIMWMGIVVEDKLGEIAAEISVLEGVMPHNVVEVFTAPTTCKALISFPITQSVYLEM